jgi:hypothetical protein
MKPFQLNQLMEAIEGLKTPRAKAPEPAPLAGDGLALKRSIDISAFRAPAQAPANPSHTAAVPTPVVQSPVRQAPAESVAAPHMDSAESTVANRRRTGLWLNGVPLLLLVAIAAFIYVRHLFVEQRCLAAQADAQRLEDNWRGISAELNAARPDGDRAAAFIDGVTRVSDMRSRLHWTAALQRLVAVTPANIELQNLEIRENRATGNGWALSIVARGALSRKQADDFVSTVQDELGRIFDCEVNCRISRAGEEGLLASGAGRGFEFTAAGKIIPGNKRVPKDPGNNAP